MFVCARVFVLHTVIVPSSSGVIKINLCDVFNDIHVEMHSREGERRGRE